MVKSEANANFIHHRVHELATDILQHSREERITDTYFEEVGLGGLGVEEVSVLSLT